MKKMVSNFAAMLKIEVIVKNLKRAILYKKSVYVSAIQPLIRLYTFTVNKLKIYAYG